jgi:hypothetical protein
MTVVSIADSHGARLSAAALPVLVGAVIYAVLLVNGDALLQDPDTYSHVALGRWIFAHQTVPMVDPLSATFAGTPWVAFEWLSDVVYAGAYAAFGWNGVAAIAALATALAFAAMARFLARQLPLVAVVVLVCAAFVVLAPHVLARPHVLALAVMVIWTGALLRAQEEGGTPPLALIAAMTVWTNLHGSFVIGLALILPIAFEAVWYAPRAARRRLALGWLGFALLAAAAALINPYGIDIFSVTYKTLALGDALTIVSEWQPQDFGHLGPFEVVVLGGIAYTLFTGMRIRWTRILMVLGLLHLALSQSRHGDIFGLLAPMFLAQPLTEHLREGASTDHALIGRGNVFAGLTAGSMLLVTAGLFALRPLAPAERITPSEAVAAADLAHAGPILNSYGFGAYLDFVGIAPFIDGRAELYGGDFTMKHHQALTLQDLPRLLTLLDKYGIRATLLAPGTPAIALLDRLPGWRRAYTDGVAVVHVRAN